MTVVHVVGARADVLKAAPVVRALTAREVGQRVIHIGQPTGLPAVVFRQLGLPSADAVVPVDSGTPAGQTARAMTAFADLFEADRPALVVVYGEATWTVAAALAASQLRIPVAHVDAGLRNQGRPDGANRFVTERLADLLFATSADVVAHLGREGIPPDRVHLVGNPVVDVLLQNLERFDVLRTRAELGLPDRYVAAVLEWPGEVDDPAELVKVLHTVADEVCVVVLLSSDGRASLEVLGLAEHRNLRVSQPLGYVESVSLVRGAQVVVTDSGEVQEETTILGVPCLTLGPGNERPVTISHGTNHVVTRSGLPGAVRAALAAGQPVWWPTPPLWDGHAGARIADVIHGFLRQSPR
jgi:UDP-N-acetylglucosamine 2-epimerase (non-hydrolysing)